MELTSFLFDVTDPWILVVSATDPTDKCKIVLVDGCKVPVAAVNHKFGPTPTQVLFLGGVLLLRTAQHLEFDGAMHQF